MMFQYSLPCSQETYLIHDDKPANAVKEIILVYRENHDEYVNKRKVKNK
jgi:hypothetical protein